MSPFLCLINPQQLKAQNGDSTKGDYEALMERYHDLGGDNWFNSSGWGSIPEGNKNVLEQSDKAPVPNYLCANRALYSKNHL